MSTVQVRELPVLDLTDSEVRKQLGVTVEDLVDNDYSVCHAISDIVRRNPGRFGGILAPSAPIRSEATLAVFQDRIEDHVEILEAPVMTPPRRLFGLFELVIDSLPVGLREPLRKLAAVIQREWARL